MLMIILILVVVYLLYKWSTSTFDYFEKQGIPYNKPFPLLGSNAHLFFRRRPQFEIIEHAYREFKDEKASGMFEARRPVLLLRDPKLIKLLTVKDFDYFMDHRSIVPEDIDPFIGGNVFVLKGKKWRDMRATLSPAFTGSRMRQMMDFVSKVGLQTVETTKNGIQNGVDNKIDFFDFALKFTIDNIASCAFGIEVNTFANPDNEFAEIAKKVINIGSFKTALKFLAYILCPQLMRALNINLIDGRSCEFFKSTIYDTMRTREQRGIVRNDLIQLLMQAKAGKLRQKRSAEEKIIDGFATVEESELGKAEVKREWSDIELAAQCFIFFTAGFVSVAYIMSFMAYELACDPDAQQKLYNEIIEMSRQVCGGHINYEQLQSMKYLDAVLSETLRKWPVAPAADRMCVKDYVLKYDDKTVKLEADNAMIIIPIWSIHRDPKYFPNPDKFDPEKFSDENKASIDPDTYMPFGTGPRSCIGSRFALMEIKTFFYYLLLNFSIEVTDKTQIPLTFEKSPIAIKPEKGIWVELRPRT